MYFFQLLSLTTFGCALAQLNYQGRYQQNYNPYNFGQYSPGRQASQYNPYLTRNYGNYNSDKEAVIIKSVNEVNPDGGFRYGYETSNGIAAEAVAVPRSARTYPYESTAAVQGSFSWTSPDGTPVYIRYVADENGYRAEGDAIPTPPPVPAAILRSLEYIKTHRPSRFK